MQQIKIILFILILFIASSLWLFYQGGRQTDPDFNKNWWSVYFVNPKSNDLDFVIDNHSDKSDFQWEVLTGGNKVQTGELKIKKGESQNIKPADIEKTADQKITIQVFSGDEKREIYKNL